MKPVQIRTGVKACIVHHQKVLVIKERVVRGGEERIIYDLPGGGIETDESLHQALHREVMEEVGLEIEILRPNGGWDFFVPTDTETVHIVCVGYLCKLLGSDQLDLSANPAKEDIFSAEWMDRQTLEENLSNFKNQDMQQVLENIFQ